MSVFIDANVPMYAGGREHPFREPARRVLASIPDTIDAVTNVEVFQEILYRYLAVGERRGGFAVFDGFAGLMTDRVLSVRADDVLRARDLAESHPLLETRDLVHLAVMEHHGIEEILSADRHFDGIPGITRIPLESFA
ncbi:MAG: type II toxin-antitoxin system VapC family toxin [Gaiellaceae bacterium MAG52_C11]|nr:type II toxin-antitoxin system VapC family toxin [Candidatus Gaiellasilicea maunaloa]